MDELPNPFNGPSIGQSERQDQCEKHGEFTSKGYRIGKIERWMGCPTCSKEFLDGQKKEDEARAIASRQAAFELRLGECGIPLRYRTKDFASFIADTEPKEKALAISMEYAQNFGAHLQKGTVAVFSGLPGTGKSHLAIAIAQNVMSGYTALYTSAIDAVRMVRDTWRRDSERTETQVLNMLSSVSLLVLDEVGVQYGTEAEQITLFDIIDKRYRDMMPTILLTNQNRAGMKAFLGDRSFDRLREGGIWVTFDWPSQRGSA